MLIAASISCRVLRCVYAVEILNGAQLSDLPVLQSTKFELVINLRTAKSPGLTIPASFLSLADELID